MVSEHACDVSTVVRCEIVLSDLAVGVPTLAQVRWSRQFAPSEFVTGLQFLLE